MDHECFLRLISQNQGRTLDLCADEQNILTLALPSGLSVLPNSQNVTAPVASAKLNEELLIFLVYARKPLWDFRTPVQARQGNELKHLWEEVANLLRGPFTIDLVKKRWRQLRDDYMRAKKKVTAYVPSGAGPADVPPRPTFKFYELIKFLQETDEDTMTISNVRLQESQSTEVSIPMATNVSTPRSTPIASPSPSTSASGIKRKRGSVSGGSVSGEQDVGIQKEILNLPRSPDAKPDGVDGFLVLIREGLRRLPLRKRNQLQIKFLQMLEEEESSLETQ